MSQRRCWHMLDHVLLQQAKTALHMNRHKFAPEHLTYGGSNVNHKSDISYLKQPVMKSLAGCKKRQPDVPTPGKCQVTRLHMMIEDLHSNCVLLGVWLSDSCMPCKTRCLSLTCRNSLQMSELQPCWRTGGSDHRMRKLTERHMSTELMS